MHPNLSDFSQDRHIGLDLARSIAIILVLFSHSRFLTDSPESYLFLTVGAKFGVELFFVLSGFLIGTVLLRQFEIGLNTKLLSRFWLRRWFRTLPAYYLILLTNYIFVRYEIINEDITQFNYSFFVFTQNFISPFYGFFWESWSLSIEEWFYIITPIFLFLFLKLFSPKLTFLLTTLIMIIFPVFYRFYNYDASIDFFLWDITFRKTVMCRLDSIGYGLFAAWGFYYYRDFWRKIWAPSLLVGCILMIFVINFQMDTGTIYKQVVYFSLVSISIMLFLPAAARFRSANGFFPYIVEYISKISYSMYLINLGLVASVIRDNFAPSNNIEALLIYCLYWIIVIGSSSFLYKYFEKPVMDLRDKKIKIF